MVFPRHQTKLILNSDQPKIDHYCIRGNGRLWDDYNWCFQINTERNTKTPLGKIFHTPGSLFCSLRSGSTQSFFGCLEIVQEVLQTQSIKEDKQMTSTSLIMQSSFLSMHYFFPVHNFQLSLIYQKLGRNHRSSICIYELPDKG